MFNLSFAFVLTIAFHAAGPQEATALQWQFEVWEWTETAPPGSGLSQEGPSPFKLPPAAKRRAAIAFAGVMGSKIYVAANAGETTMRALLEPREIDRVGGLATSVTFCALEPWTTPTGTKTFRGFSHTSKVFARELELGKPTMFSFKRFLGPGGSRKARAVLLTVSRAKEQDIMKQFEGDAEQDAQDATRELNRRAK